jgi:hypothetical protein
MERDQELIKMTSDLFAKIGQTEECRRKIADYEHAYQFEMDGKPIFYVELNRGVLKVSPGVHSGDNAKVSLIKTDSETLRGILKGKVRPLDASETGKWVVRARNYSGELMYTMLRIGREITVQELLAAQP